MQYVAMTNFTFKGKKIKKGDPFDVSGLNKYQLRGLIEWRRIKKDEGKCKPNVEPNTEHSDDFNIDVVGWDGTDMESEPNADPESKEDVSKLLTREELEAKYVELGGRPRNNWSDEKLLEMIEKKS